MKKIVLGVLAIAGLLMGSCSADDEPAQNKGNVQLEGGTGGTGGGGTSGGGGTIPPPTPPGGGGG